MGENCNIKIDGVSLNVLKLLWICAETAQIKKQKHEGTAYLKSLVQVSHPDGRGVRGFSKDEADEFCKFVTPYYRDKTEGLEKFIKQYKCQNTCCECDYTCRQDKANSWLCNGTKLYNGVTSYNDCIAYVDKPTISKKEYKWYVNNAKKDHRKLDGIGQLIIGENVETIGRFAFETNPYLKRVIFEPRTKKLAINIGAFRGCSQLSELINFPSDVIFVVGKHEVSEKYAVFGGTDIKGFKYKDTMEIVGDPYIRENKYAWIAENVVLDL
jgi:hypothetical protein